MTQPIIAYLHTLYFVGPDMTKRYFRLFGDLEYDLLALRIESEVLDLRIREVKRRLEAVGWISETEEQTICVTAHELAEHRYKQLDRLRERIVASKAFGFDAVAERQARRLLTDIAVAVEGIKDRSLRDRAQEMLTKSVQSYSRLDMPRLLDAHDRVQEFLSVERRDCLDVDERREWEQKLTKLMSSHPLKMSRWMSNPTRINQRMEVLKEKIRRRQSDLERRGMLYAASMKMLRYPN